MHVLPQPPLAIRQLKITGTWICSSRLSLTHKKSSRRENRRRYTRHRPTRNQYVFLTVHGYLLTSTSRFQSREAMLPLLTYVHLDCLSKDKNTALQMDFFVLFYFHVLLPVFCHMRPGPLWVPVTLRTSHVTPSLMLACNRVCGSCRQLLPCNPVVAMREVLFGDFMGDKLSLTR